MSAAIAAAEVRRVRASVMARPGDAMYGGLDAHGALRDYDLQDAFGAGGDEGKTTTEVFDRKTLADGKAPTRAPEPRRSDEERKRQYREDVQSIVISSNSMFILDPAWKSMVYWDGTMMALLIFTAVVTPYEVCFLSQEDVERDAPALGLFNLLVNLCFACDMIVQFMLKFEDPLTETFVKDHRTIAKRYLSSWFIIDFLSVFPFEQLSAALSDSSDDGDGSQLKLLKLTRILRLIKLTKLLKASAIMTRLEARIGLSHQNITYLSFAIALAAFSHWGACMWNLTSTMVTEGPTWRDQVEFDGGDEPGNSDLYLVCMHWSIATLTNLGSDIAPANPSERGISIAWIILGGFFYSYVVASVCAMLATGDMASQMYHQSMDMLNHYMQEHRLPPDLRRNMRSFMIHSREIHRARFYQDTLMQMSPQLRGELAMHVHAKWITEVKFFNASAKESEPFICAIAVRLDNEAFAPRERLISDGDLTEKMFTVQRGLVARLGRVLGRGKAVGEDMILRNARRHYSVRALTYVIAYSLSKHSLAEILTRGDFPETKKHIRKAAIKLALRRELVRIAASPLLSRIGATSPKAHAQGQPKAAQQGAPVAIAPAPGPSKEGPPATTAIKPSAETEATAVPPGGAGVVGMTRRITRFNTSATMDPRFLEPMGEDNPHAPKKLFKRSVSEDPDAGQEEHSTAMHLIGEEVLGPEQRALYLAFVDKLNQMQSQLMAHSQQLTQNQMIEIVEQQQQDSWLSVTRLQGGDAAKAAAPVTEK